MKLPHRHVWEPYIARAIGVFEKQKGQMGSQKRIAITVTRCKCGQLRMSPHPDYKLRDVYGEREAV